MVLNPGSSVALEFSNVHVCLYHGSRADQPQCARLGCGLCTWTAEVAFDKFVRLAACFALVATDRGLVGPSGGSCFQFFDAMLAAMLISGVVFEGHFELAEMLIAGVSRQVHHLQRRQECRRC